MSDIKSGIYQITNTIHNKIYIGSTTNFNNRWSLHKSKRSNCIKLKSAISKYGVDYFQFEILEYLDISNLSKEDTIKLLTEREQYYLDTLKLFNDRGYNIHTKSNGVYGTKHTEEFKRSRTGSNNPTAKPVSMYTLTGEYLKTYTTISEAAKDNPPASVQTIIRCCNKTAISTGGKLWTYSTDPPPIPRRQRRHTKKVAWYNNKHELIQIFNSIREASLCTNLTEYTIIKYCKNRSKRPQNGVWEYINE